VPSKAALPASRALADTAVVTLKDNRGATVTLRVPQSLHRPANAFRLYGNRPLTLRDRNRRRDLYRDAFLELATRSRLVPATSVLQPVAEQWDWLRAQNPQLAALTGRLPGGGSLRGVTAAVENAGADLNALTRELNGLAAYRHLSELGRALGQPFPSLATTEPVFAALRMRALATDAAESRLLLLGQALGVEGPGIDPALRDGYRLARAEFDQVRSGLWPAVAGALRRDQGKLVAGAIRDLVFSHLGAWALFGHLGWKGVEGALNTEYRGQYAIALATVAGNLAYAPLHPDPRPLALYAEFALNYELTEAFKDGNILELKPAGGLGTGAWQIRFTGRCDELRPTLLAAG
jgi:hypothetical protein